MVQKMVRKNGSKIVQKIVKKIVQGPNGPVDILPHALGRPRTSGMKAKLVKPFTSWINFILTTRPWIYLVLSIHFAFVLLQTQLQIRKDVLHYQETKFLLSIFPSHLCWEKSRYTRSVETKATISSWQSVRKSFRRISFLQLRLWQGG